MQKSRNFTKNRGKNTKKTAAQKKADAQASASILLSSRDIKTQQLCRVYAAFGSWDSES